MISRICSKVNVKVIIVDSRIFQLFNSFKKLRQVTHEIDYTIFLTFADNASSKLLPFRFLTKDMVF